MPSGGWVIINPLFDPFQSQLNSPSLTIHPTLWKPRNDRDWQALARKLRIDPFELSANVHSCKRAAHVPNDGDVVIDDENGNITYNGEWIGNAYDGC